MEKRARGQDRRRQTLAAVFHGGIHPRRRHNRRAADDQHFVVDYCDAGLVMVGLAIVIMSCMDAFFTLNLLTLGADEVNFFMRVLIESDARTFLIVKLFATGCGVVFLTATARYRLAGRVQVRHILEGLCAVYACLIIWELYLLTSVAALQLG